MLRQKSCCKDDIETGKKRIELKFTIWQNQVKGKLPAENADIW